MTKTYQNKISPLYSTTVEIDGHSIDIRFVIGGKAHPNKVFGKYRTSDPKIIEALDNSPLYGKNWVCISSDEPKKEKVAELIEEQPEDETPSEREITGPKTVKEMREYLNKRLGVPYSKLSNKDAAMKAAKEMNLNFVNVN